MAKAHLKKPALSIFNCGFTAKEASIMLNVSEKTLGAWKREFEANGLLKIKYGDYNLDITLLDAKLRTLTENPNSSPQDIQSVVNSIAELRNQLIIKKQQS